MDEKRKKALERLRANRGKERVGKRTRQEAKADSIKSLVKDYRDSYRSEKEQLQESDSQEADVIASAPEKISPKELPKVAKAAKRLQDKEDRTSEAVERLKEARKRLKAVRKAKQAEEAAAKEAGETSQVKLSKPHQVRQDLLTADFFKSASQWLHTISSDPRLSSSSVEEVEALYREAQYRHKVLKLMLEDTQHELDSFEVYLRNAKSASEAELSD